MISENSESTRFGRGFSQPLSANRYLRPYTFDASYFELSQPRSVDMSTDPGTLASLETTHEATSMKNSDGDANMATEANPGDLGPVLEEIDNMSISNTFHSQPSAVKTARNKRKKQNTKTKKAEVEAAKHREEECLEEGRKFNQQLKERGALATDRPNQNAGTSSRELPKLFVIKPISGKGLGMFAIKKIKSGDEIFREAPLLNAGFCWLHTEAGYMVLSDKKKQALTFLRSICYCQQKTCVETPLKKIHNMNSYKTDSPDIDGSVYKFTSRINHACVSNVKYSFTDENEIVFTAFKDIYKGQEITVDYAGVHGDAVTRRQSLFDLFGFWCRCEACRTHVTLTKEQASANLREPGKLAPRNATAVVLGKRTREEIEAQRAVDAWYMAIVDTKHRIQQILPEKVKIDLLSGDHAHSALIEFAKEETRLYLVEHNMFNLSEDVIDRYVEEQGEMFVRLIQTISRRLLELNQSS